MNYNFWEVAFISNQNFQTSKSIKIKAMIKLTRPPNSITAAVAVISALFLALGEDGSPYDFTTYLLIGSAAFFVTAHAMVHNDIVDFDADSISTPYRPLPSKMISMKEAKIWATFLFLAATTSGILIDFRLDLEFPISLFWAMSNALLLDAYNLWFPKPHCFNFLS